MGSLAGFDREVSALADRFVQERTFPGGVVGYLQNGQQRVLPFGHLRYDSSEDRVTADTLYDVASITKSVPTSCLALRLIEDGRLSLDEAVIHYIPELQTTYREDITVRHLLTYTVVFDLPTGLSGLVAQKGADFLPYLLKTPLMARPGERYFYTNPPALLLGILIERLCGASLDQLAREQFFGPLGMDDTGFNVTKRPGRAVAPTEVIGGHEIRGKVHDETARIMAGVGKNTGIAGVFSTAGDLLRFAAMLYNEGELAGRRYFKPETIREMAQNQLDIPGESTGLGWEIQRPDVMGTASRPHLFIKSGHTGCLIVVDLERKAALVHLSNRTYPKRGDRTKLRAFWSALNERFLEALEVA